MADKLYKPWNADQMFLLPPSMRQWLPGDHLVFFVIDVVAHLDISSIEEVYQSKDPRGERPWDPRMMLALLIYGYAIGVRSSRRIERATYEDVAFRILSGDQHPDHSKIAGFRRTHCLAFAALFEEALLLCRQAGMVKLGRVALDGTKMKANASKHKATSHGRMVEREKELAAEIAAILAEAEAADATEDAVHGRDRRGDEMPGELERRENRLAKIKEAKEQLEAEARAARAAEIAERAAAAEPPPEDPPPPAMPSHRVPHDTDGEPTPSAQRNFTDPDSRIMRSNGAYEQGYNAQVVVDEAEQVIVATGVSNQAPDAQHLPAMMEEVKKNLGELPVQALGDAGYFSRANVAYGDARGMDLLLATGRERKAGANTASNQASHADPVRARMRAELDGPIGNGAYRRRKTIVEPVFGQIKGARGIRSFLLRGIGRVRAEWNLICATHNLLKLFRFTRRSALAMV